MKIAFFHEVPFGGARRVVDEFGRRLGKNHTVDLYYVDEKEESQIAGIFARTFYFPFFPKKWSGNDWQTRLYKDTVELFKLSLLHKAIAELIDKEQYDFIFVHPSKFTQAPFLLRFLQTKTVYFCQEPLRMVYDDFLNKLPHSSFLKNGYESLSRTVRKAIDSVNIDRACLVIANSTFSKNEIQKAYGKEAEVCYLGVDEELFMPQEGKKEYDILFLGQKVAVEGYDLLEDALDLFDRKIVVKVIERGKNGEGILDSELVKEYNKARLVVALSRNEPFGLVVIEAMSCGVPVVAVKEGGYMESVIDEETGFLVERNPNMLYKKIEKLLADEKMRKVFGENGRKRVLKDWTWKKSVARFEKLSDLSRLRNNG